MFRAIEKNAHREIYRQSIFAVLGMVHSGLSSYDSFLLFGKV